MPGMPTRLTLLAYTLPNAFFDNFLVALARARFMHLALPYFVGVPFTAAPRLVVLDSSSDLTAALSSGASCVT